MALLSEAPDPRNGFPQLGLYPRECSITLKTNHFSVRSAPNISSGTQRGQTDPRAEASVSASVDASLVALAIAWCNGMGQSKKRNDEEAKRNAQSAKDDLKVDVHVVVPFPLCLEGIRPDALKIDGPSPRSTATDQQIPFQGSSWEKEVRRGRIFLRRKVFERPWYREVDFLEYNHGP